MENLFIGSVPKPKVTPDTVLVRVRAAGVNRADLMQRIGMCRGDGGHIAREEWERSDWCGDDVLEEEKAG